MLPCSLGTEAGVTAVAGSEHSPAIAMSAAGGFAIAWQHGVTEGCEPEDSFSPGCDDILLRRYDSQGVPIGDVQPASGETKGMGDSQPAIAMDAAGDFVVAWIQRQNCNDADGLGNCPQTVLARRYDAKGAASAAFAVKGQAPHSTSALASRAATPTMPISKSARPSPSTSPANSPICV